MKKLSHSGDFARKSAGAIAVRMWRSVLLTLLLTAGFAIHAQNTIHVPADQSTIQAGIDAAANGDTVLVAPGTYAESLDFKGKNVTVTSGAKSYAEAGAVILQQVGTQGIASFHSGESQSAVLNGFVIREGQGTMVTVTSSSPTLSNNVLSNTTGCGIVITGAGGSPMVRGNHIYGMKLKPPMPFCSVGNGSAIVAFQAGDVSIVGNTLDGSDETNPGPGNTTFLIALYYCASVRVQDNIIRDNATQGSLISAANVGRLQVIQNAVYNNVHKSTDATNYPLTGFLIEVLDNQLPVTYQVAHQGVFLNNTFVNNNASGSPVYQAGGQLQLFYSAAYYGSVPPEEMIENNLLVRTKDGSAVQCQFSSGQVATYSFNDTFNSGVLNPPTDCTATSRATANINQDPQFINLLGGNVRIADTSPAVYAGDINAPSLPAADLGGKNRTVCGQIDIGAYQTHPHPRITLSASPDPVAGGSSVTFTAQVSGNCNVPTGDVIFLDSGTAIVTGTLNSAAVATVSTSFLTVGIHHLTATYPGDFNFEDGSSNRVDLTVTGLPTATSLNVIPNPAKAFQPITLSASVTDPYVPVTGTVTFTAGTNTLGTGNLINGVAAITTTQLGAGTYAVTATFNATTQFATSSASVQVQVEGATTTTALRSSPNPSLFGQAVTLSTAVALAGTVVLPQGTVTFRDGGTALGTGTLDGNGSASFTTDKLTIGTHGITAEYSGSPNVNKSTSTVLLQVVDPITVQLALTAAPNPSRVGDTISLQLKATANNGLPPSGAATFFEGTTPLGTASMTSGLAVLSISTLTVGRHQITATYANAVSGITLVSAMVTVDVLTFDFELTSSGTHLDIPYSGFAEVVMTVTPLGAYDRAVHLECSNLPENALCVFDRDWTEPLSKGPQHVKLLINANVLAKYGSPGTVSHVEPWSAAAGTVAVCGLWSAVFLGPRRRRHPTIMMLFFAGSLVGVDVLQGCSGKLPASTPAGAYQVIVTARDATAQSHAVKLDMLIR